MGKVKSIFTNLRTPPSVRAQGGRYNMYIYNSKNFVFQNMIFCVTDLYCHLSTTLESRACGEQTPTHRWASTACVSCCVLSSFGLNSLGRSKQRYEHHQACHWAELLDVGGLFNRRNVSPLSDWQVVELTLCLWMELRVKSCNLFGFWTWSAVIVCFLDQLWSFSTTDMTKSTSNDEF